MESINIRLQDLRKPFGDRVDELTILPENPDFTSYFVSKETTLVLFASRGMLDTLAKFDGKRAHIVVDTKMKILRKQRGVATVYIQVKDKLRNTTWHVGGRRLQGNALTSHSMPVLQAVVNEESETNHADIVKAIKYSWNQAKPHGHAY